MALQLLREERLAVGRRLLLGRFVHPGGPPGLLRALHDERARAVFPSLVLVRVHPPESVLVLAEVEGEGREGLRRPQPHEAVGAPVERRAEVVLEERAHGRVHAVRPHDQVRVAQRAEVGQLRLVAHVDAHRGRLLLQDAEQRVPAHPREAVPRRADHAATVVHVDVVPVHEVVGDGPVRRLVGALHLRDRGVAEHDAEAERVVRAVPLEHHDLVRGIGALHEDREVQPGRTAADAHDLQARASCVSFASARIRPATMRCWISVVPS